MLNMGKNQTSSETSNGSRNVVSEENAVTAMDGQKIDWDIPLRKNMKTGKFIEVFLHENGENQKIDWGIPLRKRSKPENLLRHSFQKQIKILKLITDVKPKSQFENTSLGEINWVPVAADNNLKDTILFSYLG